MTGRTCLHGIGIGLILLVNAASATMAASADNSGGSKDDEIAALKKMVLDQAAKIDQLTHRVESLEKGQVAPPVPPGETPPIPAVQIPGEGAAPSTVAPSGEIPPIPPVEIPGTTEGSAATSGGPVVGSTRASLTPDISVIGNNVARFISVKGDHKRNRLQLSEVEVGLQQPVYTGVRFDAFLNGDDNGGFAIGAEEAYATFTKVAGLPLGAYLGTKRLDFGKINPVHPHARLYADQPAVLTNLLGADGLDGNGASINYTFPFKSVFTNLELGMWKTDPAVDNGLSLGPSAQPVFYPIGLGVTNNFPLARLWLSKEMGKAGELELGASDGFGRADTGDKINLAGIDFTYRNFPGTFQRFYLQGEAIWHHRVDSVTGTGGHTRDGQYLLLLYRPDQYLEYGLRLDNSQYPWPVPGHDRSASLIWSKHLTEGTLLRFQYQYGDRTSSVYLPAKKGYNNLLLQFIWAAGSHTHPLQ